MTNINEPGDYADIHYDQASKNYDESKFDEALVEVNKAIKLAPEYGDFHNLRGFILQEKDLLDEAILEFREAIRLDPSNKAFKEDLADAIKDQEIALIKVRPELSIQYEVKQMMEEQTKLLRRINTAVQIVAILILLSAIAAACSGLHLFGS